MAANITAADSGRQANPGSPFADTQFRMIGGVFGAAALLAAIGGFSYFGRLHQLDRAFGVAAALLAAASAVGSAYAFLSSERDKNSDNVVSAAVLLNIVVFLSGGLLAVLAGSEHWLAGILWSLASLFAGGILGMLVSLPSTDEEVNGTTPSPAGASVVASAATSAVTPGTPAAPTTQARKRQITALGRAAGRINGVIGGGIAFNWAPVYGEMKNISRKVGSYVGLSADQPAVAGGGLLLFFGLLGLISGILLTRIFLNRLIDVQADDPIVRTDASVDATSEKPQKPESGAPEAPAAGAPVFTPTPLQPAV